METVVELPLDQVDQLAGLWAELNDHHRALAPRFADAYAARTWPDRKAELLAKAAAGAGRIVAVRDKAGRVQAFCVASVSREGLAELDSLCVAAPLRGRGLGRRLAEDQMAWMRARGGRRFRVVVYSGNERAMRLYERLGFAPRQTVMELPSNP